MTTGLIDSCGIVSSFLTKFGIIEEEIDIHEAKKRLECEAQSWKKTQSSVDFWSNNASRETQLNPHLSDALHRFQTEGVEDGVAVDLGCGNSTSAIDLLERGWKVIAVDCTKAALDHLRQRADKLNPSWIRDGHLELIHAQMETYQFPSNTHIILASDSLNFCNPSTLTQVWERAYDSLALGGRMIGNFHEAPVTPVADVREREFMGAWFSDKAVVDALLDHSGYRKELCASNDLPGNWPRLSFDFVGQKV